MAGYKQSVLDLKPLSFLTFDADATFDPVSGYLTTPNTTIDESGNGNYGLMITTNNPIKPYAFGTQSLVKREIFADQYALTIAPYSYDTRATFPFEKAMMTIPYNTSMNLPTDFSYVFLINKSSNEVINNYIFHTESSTYTVATFNPGKSYSRTIFQKGVKAAMTLNYPYGTPAYATFTFPTYAFNWNLPTNFHNVTHHIAITFKVNNLGGGQYSSTASIYYDGYCILSYTSPNQFGIIDSSNTSDVQIGGNNSDVNYDYCNDRQTCPLVIDQFAVFNYCLTPNNVADLVKKVDSYQAFIGYSSPAIYMPLQELAVSSNAITNFGSAGVSPTYVGTNFQVIRQQIGPPNLMNDPSVSFVAGGMIKIPPLFNNQVPFNPTDDWTIEFWLKINSSTPGVVMSLQSDVYPFTGILMEVNTRNGAAAAGSIEVSIDENTRIQTTQYDASGSTIYWNDATWHHHCMIRRGTSFEYWIDGVIVNSIAVSSGPMIPNYSGAVYFMGMGPGKLEVVGNMCHIAMYTSALQSQQIQARAYYFVKYMIVGKVTLQGAPHKALIRVYDHNSGQFLSSATSDPSSGNYQFNVYNDNFVDVMVLDPSNPNIRYRSYGPVVANSYFDLF